MSNAQAACPTCPDGSCPSINTMPTSPKPKSERTALAEHAIPDVLAEQFQIGERYEAAASKLVEWLGRPRYGRHLRPAAEWAVHCLVQQGKLSAHVRFTDGEPAPTKRPRRQFVDGRLVRPKPEPAVRIYSEIANPAHFDTFIVRAEEPLWKRWCELEDTTQEIGQPAGEAAGPTGARSADNPTYRTDELCAELDKISSKTLNKYAKQAGVKTPRPGMRNHRYSEDDRCRIYRAIVKTCPHDLAKKAKELLAEIERKQSGNGNIIESSKSESLQ